MTTTNPALYGTPENNPAVAVNNPRPHDVVPPRVADSLSTNLVTLTPNTSRGKFKKELTAAVDNFPVTSEPAIRFLDASSVKIVTKKLYYRTENIKVLFFTVIAAAGAYPAVTFAGLDTFLVIAFAAIPYFVSIIGVVAFVSLFVPTFLKKLSKEFAPKIVQWMKDSNNVTISSRKAKNVARHMLLGENSIFKAKDKLWYQVSKNDANEWSMVETVNPNSSTGSGSSSSFNPLPIIMSIGR